MADLSIIEKYFHKMNIMKDEMISFLQICSPLIVHLDQKEKEKILNTAWSLFFGEDAAAVDKTQRKTDAKEIKKMWERIQDFDAQEINSSQTGYLDQYK